MRIKVHIHMYKCIYACSYIHAHMMRIYLYLDAEAPSPKNESNMLNEASFIPLYNIYVCVVYVYNISSISLV